jgi:TatD DNase family protein
VIDCHTHLTHADFDSDRAAVLERARQAGVKRIAIVGQDEAENEAVLALAGSAAAGFAASPWLPFLGLHPDRFADGRTPPAPGEVERICAKIRAERTRIVGIGEVGLDYWVCADPERRELQREALGVLVKLALELHLPLNVHSRSAGQVTLDFLLGRGAQRVLMHAFDGKAGHALRGAEAGFLFSIPPSIVRSPQKQRLVRVLPLSALALETDSPVLGPRQGERNEPANVCIGLRAIAEIKGLPETQVREATEANAARLFGLAPVSGSAQERGSRGAPVPREEFSSPWKS